MTSAKESRLARFDDYQFEQIAPRRQTGDDTVQQVGAQGVGVIPLGVGDQQKPSTSRGHAHQGQSELRIPGQVLGRIIEGPLLPGTVGVDAVDGTANIAEELAIGLQLQRRWLASRELDQFLEQVDLG